MNRYTDYQFSLQGMADDLHLSVSSIGRMHKQFTGSTVMEFVNELRIAKAKELLQDTNLPVKEIVERIGYKDVSSFIRKFKQQFGITPIDYRNYCRKKSVPDDESRLWRTAFERDAITTRLSGKERDADPS
jgi:AraC-like DNA-binding protein